VIVAIVATVVVIAAASARHPSRPEPKFED
jgi:hypothetical protein